MTNGLSNKDRREIELIVHRMQEAWNAGSGSRFVEAFATDADFVTVRGDYLKGLADPHRGGVHITLLTLSNRIPRRIVALII